MTDTHSPPLPGLGQSLSQPALHRRVWRLAGPVILANLSTPLLGATDTAVLGHLPDPTYLGAIAIGSLIFDYIYWGFGFLRMGTTGLVAQAHGSGKTEDLRLNLVRGLVVALLIAVLLLLLAPLIRTLGLSLLDPGERIGGLAGDYFSLRILGAPAVFINMVVLGVLFGTQRMGLALFLQIFMNGLNIFLDLLFVLKFGWDVKGVAGATLISETIGAMVGLYIVARPHLKTERDKLFDWKKILEPQALRRFISINTDIFLRTLLLVTAFALFTWAGTRLGELPLAANQVLMKLQLFLAFGLDGYAHAAEALVGSAKGEQNRASFRTASLVSGFWALVTAILYSLVFWGFGDKMIALLTTGTPEVAAMAEMYLPWLIIMPLASFWCYHFDGIFIGATQTRAMRNSMASSFAFYVLSLFVLMPFWGNHGVWLALILFNLARGLTMGLAYPAMERAVEKS